MEANIVTTHVPDSIEPTDTTPILSHWINGRPVEVLRESTGAVHDP